MKYYNCIYILICISLLANGFNIKFPNNFFALFKHKNNPSNKSNINQINGFYGLVGPNIDISKTNTLFQLFTGDGIIQGIFLENGNITQVNHIIQTEKIKYENKHGKFNNNMIILPFYMFLNKIGILPNVMGLANTAFMKIKEKMFVLFERDLPYEILVNYKDKTIQTMKKINIQSINHFSAHSTVDKQSQNIYSLEYNVLRNIVSLFHMNENLDLLKRIDVQTNYIPIVHDSYILPNTTIFTDSPLYFSAKHLLHGKVPVVFNNKKPTFIHEICRKNGIKTTYRTNESFYIFHYANITETKNTIEILAPLYDELDFSELNISGKYRRLIMNKETKMIQIDKNPELEEYNLDFPMKWRNHYILRNIKNNRINGFVICNGLKIQRKIWLNDVSICGEPKIYDNGIFSRIMCLGYDDVNKGYFILIDPENGNIFRFPLDEKVKIGFHSIFTNMK